MMSEGEEIFLRQCIGIGLPKPEREHMFLAGRRFRFDFAWTDVRLGVEVEGGVFSKGRHTRGVGYSKDLEKYNLAAMHGWTVYRFTTQDVKSGIAVGFMEIIINNKGVITSYDDIGGGSVFTNTDNTTKQKAKDKA
jgi:hypothetical protein